MGISCWFRVSDDCCMTDRWKMTNISRKWPTFRSSLLPFNRTHWILNLYEKGLTKQFVREKQIRVSLKSVETWLNENEIRWNIWYFTLWTSVLRISSSFCWDIKKFYESIQRIKKDILWVSHPAQLSLI